MSFRNDLADGLRAISEGSADPDLLHDAIMAMVEALDKAEAIRGAAVAALSPLPYAERPGTVLEGQMALADNTVREGLMGLRSWAARKGGDGTPW